MKTDWLFQDPIDLEHKQYVLLDYLQKVDKNLQELKLYPNFQSLSLHLANINLLIEKGQYLTLSRAIKDADDEILLSDLVFNTIPKMSKEEYSEVFDICSFSNEKFKDYFNFAKSLWEIVNDSVLVKLKTGREYLQNQQGLFFIDIKNEKFLYEYCIKKIKKNANESKCIIKRVGKSNEKNYKDILIVVKNPLIKNLLELVKNDEITIFEVIHSGDFPIKETTLPIAKRKVMNYTIQSQVIENKNLTKKK
jgi:hypothetical protein